MCFLACPMKGNILWLSRLEWNQGMQASQGVVYSYLRFSDPRQAAGNSADRQAEYAKSWAAGRGLTLDESRSLRDEGLSAFHQRHIKQGALGVFLQAVDEGRIPAGHYRGDCE